VEPTLRLFFSARVVPSSALVDAAVLSPSPLPSVSAGALPVLPTSAPMPVAVMGREGAGRRLEHAHSSPWVSVPDGITGVGSTLVLAAVRETGPACVCAVKQRRVKGERAWGQDVQDVRKGPEETGRMCGRVPKKRAGCEEGSRINGQDVRERGVRTYRR
jgi:hypothetical protein